MGITISFRFNSPSATVWHGIDQLQAITQDLPFKYVGEVIELVGEQCNHQNSDNEELLVLKIQAVAKRIEQGKLQKYKPDHIIGFTVIPGEGCEFMTVFLAHYRELGENWQSESYCKTQFATEVGIPHFVFCHTAIVSFLDQAAKIGLLDTSLDSPVIDEAEYWEQRNLKKLASKAQLEQEKIENMGTLLKNYVLEHRKNNEPRAFWSWFEHKINSDCN